MVIHAVGYQTEMRKASRVWMNPNADLPSLVCSKVSRGYIRVFISIFEGFLQFPGSPGGAHSTLSLRCGTLQLSPYIYNAPFRNVIH